MQENDEDSHYLQDSHAGETILLQNNSTEFTLHLKNLGPIRGYTRVTGKEFDAAKRIIKLLDFGLLWRRVSAGTITTDGNVRLDLQGFTEGHKQSNFQIQTGSSTISGTLVDSNLASLTKENDRSYLIRIVRSAFEKSLLDGNLYSITG
ncbi:MAG: hypothetical protein ACRCV3_05895 [Desulfovibrionaceae bacterium]